MQTDPGYQNSSKHLGLRPSRTGNVPTPSPQNKSDTVHMYRNMFYLGNISQNKSVSKIDSKEYGLYTAPPSPKITLGVSLPLPPWDPLV